MLRSIVALAFLAISCSAHAEQYKHIEAALSLDALGSVSAVEFNGPVADKLADALRAKVRQWRFKPVLVDGQPRAATLNLSIKLGFEGDGERMKVRVVRASTGLRPLELKAPKYPRSELKKPRSGNVVMKLLIDLDGSVASATAIHATNPSFSRAAIRAASSYRFEPLLVDGQPARAEIYMPARFYTGGRPLPLPELPELQGSELQGEFGALAAEMGGQLASEVSEAL